MPRAAHWQNPMQWQLSIVVLRYFHHFADKNYRAMTYFTSNVVNCCANYEKSHLKSIAMDV